MDPLEQNLDLHVLSNDQILEHPHLISQSSNFIKTQNYTRCQNNGSSLEIRSSENTIIKSQSSSDPHFIKSDVAEFLNRESLSGFDDPNYSPGIVSGPHNQHVQKPKQYSVLNTDNFSRRAEKLSGSRKARQRQNFTPISNIDPLKMSNVAKPEAKGRGNPSFDFKRKSQNSLNITPNGLRKSVAAGNMSLVSGDTKSSCF